VDRVQVPEWFDCSSGRHQDVLRAWVIRNEMGDVVNAFAEHNPHAVALAIMSIDLGNSK
jgi:hypothetical protein